MEKESIYTVMEAIIMGIGSKEKCKEKANFMIQMETYNMKENGEMITMKEKVFYMDLVE